MLETGKTLLSSAPIIGMEVEKKRLHGVSYGLGEAGYDIRIKQDITFKAGIHKIEIIDTDEKGGRLYKDVIGHFVIASAIEEFDMPTHLTGIVHDKSTWARRGLSVFNTVIEPGWKGFLTLELVYHGQGTLHIPAGAGIAQVVFHRMSDTACYDGKYQNQANQPIEAIYEKS